MAVLYVLTALGALTLSTVGWMLAEWLGLTGVAYWLLFVGFLVLAIGAAAAVIWYRLREKKQQEAQESPAESAGDIDFIVREAQSKLSSSAVTKGADLNAFPLFFVLGDPGSTKTSVITNSGLSPELLAGQVFAENKIVPTQAANVWFAAGRVFVEIAGRLISDRGKIARLAERLKPALGGVLGKDVQAGRAALVCCDLESLAGSDPETASSNARRLNGQINLIAEKLGSRLPVYVLFTRIDRLPYFADYVRTLSRDEATQTFGATLPLAGSRDAGVYAEGEAQRLNAAFRQLSLSLAEKRLDFLKREIDPAVKPNTYEFPREFRKLRDTLVRFLVELGRPSQLHVGAVLRGFYFSGVRPIHVSDTAPAPSPAPSAQRPAGADATQMFRLGASMAEQPAPPSSASTRRVPQWVFLPHFFGDVLLKDAVAMGASSSATRVQTRRRLLLAAAAALLLVFGIGATTSFFSNRGLQSDAESAGAALKNFPQATQPAMERLEQLRAAAEKGLAFDKEGAPMRYRWFLYPGYEPVVRLYCREAERLVVGPVRESFRTRLAGLPSGEPTVDYSVAYNTLKGYLMTTSAQDKGEPEFLTSLMSAEWAGPVGSAQETRALADRQFAFYSGPLRASGYCQAPAKDETVQYARAYLLRLPVADRLYQRLVNEASKKHPPVRFSDPAGTVVDRKEVAGAFTQAGYKTVSASFGKVPVDNEPWVLGDQLAASQISGPEIQEEVRKRYLQSFISEWRSFLSAGNVTRYSSIQDAASKLKTLSGTTSPLFQLICLASKNTNVDSKDIKDAFAPIQGLAPPDTCSTTPTGGEANDSYLNGLVALQINVDNIANNAAPGADTGNETTQAKIAVRQTAQALNLDPTTSKLLEDPITYADSVIRGQVPAELNGKGKGFCAEFRKVSAKFPFSPKAQPEVSLQELGDIFQPETGKFWIFVQDLGEYVSPRGDQFIAKPGRVKISSQFLEFLSKMARISRSFYPAGPDPNLAYGLETAQMDDIERVRVDMDGKSLQATKAGQSESFVWPGARSGSDVSVMIGGQEIRPQYPGLWGAFRFLLSAERQQPAGANTQLEWDLQRETRFGGAVTKSGKTATLRLILDMKGRAPVFSRGYLAGLNCVSNVAE